MKNQCAVAISVKQPWAFAIIHLKKDIENRTWKTKHRGLTYIHAAKTFDYSAPEWLIEKYNQASEEGRDATMRGGLVGYVDIVDCVDKSDSKWFQGPHGFVLERPMPMVFKPYRGQLSFFEVVI